MIPLKFGSQIVYCRGIIFDKDGTLLDSFVIWPRLIQKRVEYLEQYFPLDVETKKVILKAMGLQENDMVARRSPIVVGTRRQTAAAVATVLFLYLGVPWDEGLAKTLEAFSACDEKSGLEWQAVLIPGVKETLERLYIAGCKLAVATNDDLERTLALMELSGLKPYISAYACRDEVSESKPAPEMVFLASERMGLLPSECAVVGDSLLDIEMGKRAGVKIAVGVTTGACLAHEMEGQADIILPSVAAIAPL